MDKYCSGCGERKLTSLFSKNKSQKDGYSNWCKACLKKLWQRPENLLRRKERRFINFAHTLYIETKSRAKKSNIPFNIEESDIVIPQVCPVLGIELVTQLGGRTDATPTIDKKIPSKGYVKGNIEIISWLANSLKRDCIDPVVFERLALYVRSFNDE